MKLALLVTFVLPALSQVCRYGKQHKLTQMVCSNCQLSRPGWETQLTESPDWEKLIFRNVSGVLDLSNVNATGLTYMSVVHSQIANVSFGDFPNLVFLSVVKNPKFPNLTRDFFKPVTHISWLSLVGNNHSIAPDAFHLLENLTWLHIQNQEISHLADNFFKENTKLHEVSLRHCQIQTVGVDVFGNTTDLEILGLNFNSLKYFESGTFRNLKKLRILELHHNRFVDFNLEQFHGLSSLEVLGLPSNFLKSVDLDGLVATFPNLKKMEVKRKDLRNNATTLVKQLRKKGIDIIGTPHDCHHSLANCRGI